MEIKFTKADLARLCGLSRSAISHAVERGTLGEDLDGNIALDENIEWFGRQLHLPRAHRLLARLVEIQKAAKEAHA